MRQYSVQERRDKIIDILNEKGRVYVNKLSELFEVSSVVIRTDLAELERLDLLSRVHGGAITSYKSYCDMNLIQRSNINLKEKNDIAQKVKDLVKDHDTLMMNAGTTPLFVMRAIMDKKVTIVTNSIAMALEGAKNPNFKIILLGGDVDPDYQFTYGFSALKELSQYSASTLILSVDGIDTKDGISTFYYHEAEICRKMISRSNRVIIAADNSKIGRTAFSQIDSLQSVDVIVTNKKASEEQLDSLKAKGIEIIIA